MAQIHPPLSNSLLQLHAVGCSCTAAAVANIVADARGQLPAANCDGSYTFIITSGVCSSWFVITVTSDNNALRHCINLSE